VEQDIDREQWQRVSAILDATLDLPPAAREGHLDAACAGDAALRRLVEELLAASGAAGSFLAGSALERAGPLAAEMLQALDEPAEGTPGRLVGTYRLLEELGEGGMGTVYLAERADGQFERQVAVKLLKHGLHGEESRRRFRQERQILARLEHPGIARLLDGGVTEEGTPFFVMERVEGRPVTADCDARRLGVEARLRVFLQVCEAVQYAHRNLVVHRDLKPSNILVDGAGTVKLLDFGVAKLLAEGEGGAPATRTLLRAMTPEYAAPEQVRGDPVTTATDVYALGVLLYELLTGQSPYRVGRTLPSELERAVLEQEPTRPSARAAAPADRRRRLRGDLDWIVLKALHKEPERRYPSAEALATDIRRHLEGLPVSARGDAVGYRALKFLRRHRLGVAAAGLVLLALLAGLVGTAWQARRAEREARKAEAVKDFLKSLFEASDPAEAQGKERTARQLLEDGARRIETELRDQPEVQSEVARLVAAVYHELGEYDRARALLSADLERRRRLDGSRSRAVADLLTEIADASYEQNRFDEAGAMYEEALGIQREQRGGRTPEVATLLWDLAGVKRNRGDLAGAEQMQKQALALFVETRGEDSAEATNVRESLAITYGDSDRYVEAEAAQRPVAAARERRLGPDHPETLNARYNHAIYLVVLGRTAEALHIGEDVVARQRRVLGPRHDRLAISLRLMARALDAAGRTEEALPYIAEALAIHRERHGPAHLQVAVDLGWRGMIEAHSGRLAEAERDGRAALGFFTAQAGLAPRLLAITRWQAGTILAEAGRLEEAEGQLAQAVALFRGLRQEGLFLARALDAWADVARTRGMTAQATERGRLAVAVLERSAGPDSAALALARVHTGAALWAGGEPAEGERLLRAGTEALERAFPGGHHDLAAARFLLGQALARGGDRAKARRLLQEALDWRRTHLGPADPRTVAVQRALTRSS
jgi:eukaryotic-like serine/threonine-protein kinase